MVGFMSKLLWSKEYYSGKWVGQSHQANRSFVRVDSVLFRNPSAALPSLREK